MSTQLKTQLELEGYDSATAAEIIRDAESKPDDIAKEYLSDVLESQASIDRYIANRARSKPESLSRKSSPAPRATPRNHTSTSQGSGRLYSRPLLNMTERKSASPQPQPSPKEKENKQITREFKIESIKDLDAAIKQLDVSDDRRPCDCMGSLHGLLDIAPNCLECGKVVCNKEGLGPCLSCGKPLVSNEELDAIYSILNQQRSAIINSMGKNALRQAGIDPKSVVKTSANLGKAQKNLDRLLGYQKSEAQRTRIIDQYADFETPDSGTNKWASQLEQARQLRNQQRQLRKQHEMQQVRKGRRKVVSINIKGGKVYQDAEDIPFDEDESSEEEVVADKNDGGTEERFFDAGNFGKKFIAPEYPKEHKISLPVDKGFSENCRITHDENEIFAA